MDLRLIRARRATLAAQVEQQQTQYAEVEQVLRDLDRSILMSVGRLAEIDDWLAQVDQCDQQGLLADLLAKEGHHAERST